MLHTVSTLDHRQSNESCQSQCASHSMDAALQALSTGGHLVLALPGQANGDVLVKDAMLAVPGVQPRDTLATAALQPDSQAPE